MTAHDLIIEQLEYEIKTTNIEISSLKMNIKHLNITLQNLYGRVTQLEISQQTNIKQASVQWKTHTGTSTGDIIK